MPWPSWAASVLLSAATLACIGAFANADAVATTVNPAIYQYVCPSGFDLVNGQCRGFVQQIDWEDVEVIAKSVEICGALIGYPPIIHTEEENEYWNKYPKVVSSSNNDIVIGIICNLTSKTWIWADGSNIDYKPPSYDSDLDQQCSSNKEWYLYRTYLNTSNEGKWLRYAGSGFESFDIHCITDLKKPEIREDDCFHFEESDSMCYQVSSNAENWSEAQNFCRSVGANLVSIHSEEENSYIRRLAVSRGYVNGIQLGATVSGKGNNFAWIDGSEWDYTNFIPEFPIDGFGDCLIMNTADVNGHWANNDCSAKLPFVCSRKPFTDSPPQTCPGAEVKEGDIIRTPGFPMDANTFCDFFLKVDTGKQVEIEVILLEANTNVDNFVLFEGSFGGDIIANLTGAIGGVTFRTTSSNIMRASWQPNGAVNVRGAMFTFRAV